MIFCSDKNTLPEGASPSPDAIEYGCHACEYVLDSKVYRCSKFISMTGKDPQSKDTIKEQSRCAEAWKIILMVDNSGKIQSTTAAIESMRNEQVERQDQAIGYIQRLKNGAKIINVK